MGLGTKEHEEAGRVRVHPVRGQQSVLDKLSLKCLWTCEGLSPEAAGCLWSQHHSCGTKGLEVVNSPGMNECPIHLLWLCTLEGQALRLLGRRNGDMWEARKYHLYSSNCVQHPPWTSLLPGLKADIWGLGPLSLGNTKRVCSQGFWTSPRGRASPS